VSALHVASLVRESGYSQFDRCGGKHVALSRLTSQPCSWVRLRYSVAGAQTIDPEDLTRVGVRPVDLVSGVDR
jgi:hypothetical protein